MLIDVHAHVLPREYPADAPECFPRMDPIDGETARLLNFGPFKFKARDAFFDAERRVQTMDESGVDAEVLTPMPPLLRYDLPAADGLAIARYVNESIAALCAAAPDRLFGFGMVPMQDPEIAAAELTTFRDLGLYGVEIASNVLGVSIGDERFLPFFAEAQRLDIPVFVHAMPAPTDRLPLSTMGTYVVGIEGTLAAASMVAGGTAAQCPRAADLVQSCGRRISADVAAGTVLLEWLVERGAEGAGAGDHARRRAVPIGVRAPLLLRLPGVRSPGPALPH